MIIESLNSCKFSSSGLAREATRNATSCFALPLELYNHQLHLPRPTSPSHLQCSPRSLVEAFLEIINDPRTFLATPTRLSRNSRPHLCLDKLQPQITLITTRRASVHNQRRNHLRAAFSTARTRSKTTRTALRRRGTTCLADRQRASLAPRLRLNHLKMPAFSARQPRRIKTRRKIRTSSRCQAPSSTRKQYLLETSDIR